MSNMFSTQLLYTGHQSLLIKKMDCSNFTLCDLFLLIIEKGHPRYFRKLLKIRNGVALVHVRVMLMNSPNTLGI